MERKERGRYAKMEMKGDQCNKPIIKPCTMLCILTHRNNSTQNATFFSWYPPLHKKEDIFPQREDIVFLLKETIVTIWLGCTSVCVCLSLGSA